MIQDKIKTEEVKEEEVAKEEVAKEEVREAYSKYITKEEVQNIIDNLSPLDSNASISSPPHTGICC
jgi:hypothetical protein